MTKLELKILLRKKPSYLKKGPKYLSEMFSINEEEAKEALQEAKNELKDGEERPIKRLFFDIETTPNVVYTWRAGYNITISHDSIIKERRIISIHWKWEGSHKVEHLVWDENQGDKKMLESFIKIANSADEIIAHNGDKFDMKWLRTRCIFHRIPMFPEYKTLDTLKKARKFFNFNSNKLDYISKFLGVGAKTKHEGYSLWLKTMDGDLDALVSMLEYGDNDVVILEDVFRVMMPYVTGNMHHGVTNGKEVTSCPNCMIEDYTYSGMVTTIGGTIQRKLQCNGCGTQYKISNARYLKL